MTRRFFLGSGLLAAVVLGLQCHPAGRETNVAKAPRDLHAAHIDRNTVKLEAASAMEVSPQEDPLGFLRHCLDMYEERVDDYTCIFTKQEQVDGRLGNVQKIAVRFRDEPYSVDMTWLENPGGAQRVLYVEGQWQDSQNRPLAWIKPSGSLIKLMVPSIQLPIHGRRVRENSRRTMDEFGFGNTLEMIIEYSERAKAEGVLDLRYVGSGNVASRPTHVFERYLPYTGQEEPYPDALLRVDIDQEWLVPTACYSYADAQGEELLGSYVLTDVEFNVGLAFADFDPETLGF